MGMDQPRRPRSRPVTRCVRFRKNATSIPIGKPIANTTIYVLDAWRNLVPIGVVGEIHVGGPGLARGYVGAPELTAERFVPDPFSTQPGARLYRTGDRGRWLADGTLECLGRMDQQVKIRGFRVEPGEVEAALKQHHRVRDAVVVVRRVAGEDTRLVAYIAGKSMVLRESTLREYLKSKLPDYLVPAAFVFLDQLPLTPNGKVDRRALPEPEVKVGQETVPPRNAAETKLTALWEKVLGV
jgi:acyl-CoA synthetase (AMP-forming)/AMP-acid ligase II